MLFELTFGPAPLTPPVAQDQSVTTLMNVPVGVTLTATDVNGDNLTYEIVDDPGSGTLTGTPPNVTYTADTGFTGPDSFTFRAHDGTEYSNTATVSITVTANQATVSVRVSQSSDDAEERASGGVSLSSGDLEMVFDRGGNQTVGVRFTGVAVPRGATVLSASIQFQAEDVTSGATNLTIQGQATDNAPTFTGAAGGISSRPKTAAAVAWSPAPWPTIGVSGPAQRSPELAAVVQEIVDRPGWSSTNALVMIITGTGERSAESYDGTPAGAPLLEIVYTLEPAANVGPVVDAGVDQVAVLPGGVILDGSVSDDGLPVPPGVVSVVWSVDSGPGVVTFGDASAADTSAAFSVDGEYVLRLTGDDGVLSGSDTAVITVDPPAANVPSLDVRIAAAGDDVEQNESGAVSFNSSDLEMVLDKGGNQTLGLRFIGIDIPQGATVVDAWIQFKADESHSGATNLVLRAHDVGDAPVFGSSSGSLSSLPLTTSSAPWSVPAWTVVGASGPAQQTPGLSTVVQEVLDRTDWARGNALVIVITGAGERVAESYNGDQAGAPLLHLEYVASGQQPPAVDAGPDQVVSPGVEVALSATVTDDGLPDPPGAVSTTWSVVTGPGTVSFGDANAQTTTATFSTPGTYVLQLDAYDGDRTGSDQVVITVTNPSGEVTLEVQVAASSDDAEEGASGGTSLRSGDLEMVQASTDQTVGLRFVGVEVPSGATITGAYIQFQADETDNVATTLLLQGQAADSAAPFASSDFNVSSRARTTASRSWSPPAWSATGEAGAAQRTDDLSGVIQEIVDRGGWSSSNAIVIIVSGTGKRVAESYDGNQAGAATLTISYIP